jgi:serine protease
MRRLRFGHHRGHAMGGRHDGQWGDRQSLSGGYHQLESGRHRSCPSTTQSAISTLTGMGVLIVASAGNEGGAASMPRAIAAACWPSPVAQCRHQGGLQQLRARSRGRRSGRELCQHSGRLSAIHRHDDQSRPDRAGDEQLHRRINYNLGTSFSAPIVSGIAALMRAVNANLTPAQLIARIESSASPFPQPAGTSAVHGLERRN